VIKPPPPDKLLLLLLNSTFPFAFFRRKGCGGRWWKIDRTEIETTLLSPLF